MLFKLFLLAQFVSLTRNYFLANFSGFSPGWATFASFGSLVLLPFIVSDYGFYASRLWGNLQLNARQWLTFLFLAVYILTLYGVYQGYGFEPIMDDTGVYLILITCVILGSIKQFWDDMFPTFLALTVLAVVVNFLGLQEIDELLQGRYEARVARDLVAYKTRDAVELWPLLLLTVSRWNRRTALLIFGLALFALVQQITFQKRLFVAEAIAYFLVFWFVIPRHTQRWQFQIPTMLQDNRNRFVATLALGIVVILITIPQVFTGQLGGLFGRYGTEDEKRFQEAIGMLDDLHGWEYVVGRGMGGYFQFTDERGVAWGTYLADVGTIGKRTVHAGITEQILKGGVIFSAIYYWGIVLVWRERRRFFADTLNLAAATIIAVKLVASLQGGYLNMSAAYEVVLFGLSMGRLLSLDNAEPGELEKT
ncbi:MAG: hypothetical protein JW963_12650 [Anaerolineales bacterium]|nr:hypothetical protein [Anaerolineales bacterium]